MIKKTIDAIEFVAHNFFPEKNFQKFKIYMEVGVRTSDFFEEINRINNINNILLILKKYNNSDNVIRSNFCIQNIFG